MLKRMKRVVLAVLAIVVFVQPAWGRKINRHHFLYVLGRAENKARDSSRTAVVNAPKDQEQGTRETQ